MHTYIYICNAHTYVLQAWVYVRVCVCMVSVPNHQTLISVANCLTASSAWNRTGILCLCCVMQLSH